MKTELNRTILILLIISSVSDSNPINKSTMNGHVSNQESKDLIAVLRNIQGLENEAKQFQKEAHERKKDYSSPYDMVHSVMREHPLIKQGEDIYGDSQTFKIGCLLKFHFELWNIISEIHRESVNFTCEDLEEFHETLDSMLKDLIESRMLVEGELKNEIDEPTVVCEQYPTKCDRARKFIDKAEVGYVIVFGLMDVLPKLKETCLMKNLESEKTRTDIQKRLLEPIVKCIYPHEPELILKLASNHIAT